jgi:hypothetical protein
MTVALSEAAMTMTEEIITIDEAARLYARLTKGNVTGEFLVRVITMYYPYLGRFRVRNGGSRRIAGVDRKRFTYFVRTRHGSDGTNDPIVIFGVRS